MKRPLTRVLVNVVAKGFYREHTGLLLSLFIVIFINFFYTSVLNQTHLTKEMIIQNALKLVITIVSEPLGMAFFFGLCFLYSLKSWQYVTRRLTEADVQFLFYSSNALRRAQQVQSWFLVQLVVSIPIIALGIFAMIVGVAYGHWLIPLLIPVYLSALLLYGATHYTYLINNTVVKPAEVIRLTWLRSWPKPLFSLFLYEVIAKRRIAYAVTKAASAASIALIFSVLPDARTDSRLFGVLGLCAALAHAILVYQSSEFDLTYLRFARNFPYNQWQRYWQQAMLYGLLLLPEAIWLLTVGGFSNGLTGAFLMLGITLLFRTLLYGLGQRIDYYLRTVFGLFAFSLLTILFGFTALLAVCSLVAAWALAYRYRYQSLG